jgi:hypothetical protein
MTHSEFKVFVSRELGQLIKEEGATLYSSFETIRKGELYILGLNPGGGKAMTIEKSLDRIEKEDYNEYTIDWGSGAGQHPLQKNIVAIAKLFDLNVLDVCASNLIFVRSRGQAGAGYESRDRYWPIHKHILSIVRPSTIIAFGNGAISPYRHLEQMAKDKIYYDSIDAGHGNYKCRSFIGKIEEQRITVIGLPHLSRYSLYTDNPAKRKVLNWIKDTTAKGNC